MGFASLGNEKLRLLTLVIVSAAIELFVLSGSMFSLLKTSALWSPPLQLLALLLPRFVVMTLLVVALGPFRKGLRVGFLALYALLLLVRFSRAEAYVDWGSTIGAGRATLPYVAGPVGAIFGFWLRRTGAGSGVPASKNPPSHL